MHKLYLERAENELNLARITFQISNNKKLQNNFSVSKQDTYFSAVISHSYYSIFYSAKSYLATKGIKTKVPEEHKKTYEEFKKLTEQGIIDFELLKIYEKIMIRADSLLKIFKTEKGKRARFTYKTLPQANKKPAEESIKHAEIFLRNIYNLVEN